MTARAGWIVLTLAAVLVALGIWELPQPVGPVLPEGNPLLAADAGWYLQAAYLGVGAVLALLGAWLIRRGGSA